MGRVLQNSGQYEKIQRSAEASRESPHDQRKHERKMPEAKGMNHWKGKGENPQSVQRASNSSRVEKPHNIWGTE